MKTLITETRSELITKICSKCKENKLADDFHSKGRNRGKASQCKDCRNSQIKIWRANNQDKCRAYYRRCNATRPIMLDRAIRKAIKISNNLYATSKICSQCHVEQPLNAYYAQAAGAYGVASWCKSCCRAWNKSHFVANKDHIYHVHKQWQIKNRTRYLELHRKWYYRRRDKVLETKYGLAKGTIKQWLEQQQNKCPCCQRTFSENVKAHVHHCHNTGYVFGLWCQECNLMEGIAKKIGDTSALLALNERMNNYTLFYYGPGT